MDMMTSPHARHATLRTSRSALRSVLAFALSATLMRLAAADPVIESVRAQKDFTIAYEAATDLSGITWISGDDFCVVSDDISAIFPLRLEIDRESGAIKSAKFGAKIPVKTDLADFEGIAWQPDRRRFFISCEQGNGIVGFDEQGDARFPITVPAVFNNARQNKSLESMTFGAGHFWTANEDTLEGDGEMSSQSKAGLVRIQKFDKSFKPVAQFACLTDTSLLRVGGRGSGLTDLCALPDGRLLALERVVAAGLVARIFLVDFAGATDTSGMKRLERAEFKPVGKKLLFEQYTGNGNFEGIALGPELAGGWRSLILIADSGGELQHRLIPLRIKLDRSAERK